MNKFKCPVCNGALNAWADLDAKVTLRVTETGALEVLSIKNVFQVDGRAGVECTECDWYFAASDCDQNYPQFIELADKALEKQEQIYLLSPKSTGE